MLRPVDASARAETALRGTRLRHVHWVLVALLRIHVVALFFVLALRRTVQSARMGANHQHEFRIRGAVSSSRPLRAVRAVVPTHGGADVARNGALSCHHLRVRDALPLRRPGSAIRMGIGASEMASPAGGGAAPRHEVRVGGALPRPRPPPALIRLVACQVAQTARQGTKRKDDVRVFRGTFPIGSPSGARRVCVAALSGYEIGWSTRNAGTEQESQQCCFAKHGFVHRRIP